MAATIVGRSAKERSLVLVDTFFLNLFIAYLDLTSKALYSLDVCESLSSQLACSSLHLLNAWRKTTDSAQSFEGSLCMHQSSPRIRYIQEQCICVYLQSLNCKAVIDDIAPSGGDVGEAEITEKLFGDLCALLVEFECIEMAVFDSF